MKIKHYELAVPEANPFQFCVLGREKYAQALMSMMMRYKMVLCSPLITPEERGKRLLLKCGRLAESARFPNTVF